MKCNQPRPGFELVSLCPFPTMITITPRAEEVPYIPPNSRTGVSPLGARGVMVIVTGYGHGDPSSIPGQD